MSRRLTSEEHRSQVAVIHGDALKVVDSYSTAHTKIRYQCPKHGVFWAKPANVVHRRSGCRRCYEATISARCRKPHNTYVIQAKARGISVLGRYTGAHTAIKHRCDKGHIWEAKPNQILSAVGCPRCDRSQYRRRPVQVGNRCVMVQGSEGRAVTVLLEEGADPTDLAFVVAEGLPTFRYRFDGRWRTYIPDIYRHTLKQVIEVKSAVTLGIYDEFLYSQVRAKARAVLRAGYAFRLMVIHRNQLLDLGCGWHRLSWGNLVDRFKQRARAQDRRYRRARRSEP